MAFSLIFIDFRHWVIRTSMLKLRSDIRLRINSNKLMHTKLNYYLCSKRI